MPGAIYSSLFHRFVFVGYSQKVNVREYLKYKSNLNIKYNQSFGRMVKTQQRLYKMIDTVQFFIMRQWNFTDDNVRNLLTEMNPKDSQSFPFDISVIDWDKYLENYVLGVRKFLWKQNPTSLPSCRRKISRFLLIYEY